MRIDPDANLLVFEVDRQLQALSEMGRGTGDRSAKQSVTVLQEEDDGYRNCLQRLRTGILNWSDDGANVEIAVRQISVDDRDCLWKIPTFSSPLSSFIQPQVMIQRTNAICRVRQRRHDMHQYTDDILADSSLQTWASREVSSTIIVQGTSQSTDHLCRLSCDIVNHLLGQKYATVYILNNADTREYLKRLGADELLRQISCQLLRAITAVMPMSFLVGILPRFQNASTSKDWFHIMELLMQKLTSIFIVIDASVLKGQAKTADMWVAELDAIFQRLPEKTTLCTKVMILSNRQLDSSSDQTLHVNVGSNSNKAKRDKTFRPAQGQEPTIQSLTFFIPTNTRDKLADDSSQPCTDPKNLAANDEESKQWLSVTREGFLAPDMLTMSYRQYNKLSYEENVLHGSLMRDKGNTQSPTTELTNGHATRLDPVQISSQEYHRRQEIGVAIICALSWEADAVEVLCDKIYNIHDFGMAAGDLNVYNVVQIGRHKVVILFMPAMGKSNAAASARDCLHSFPNIRVALLTGICGGIPSPYTKAEIILGDVVVSDRLVVYDFGRQFPGDFKRKDTTLDNARKPLPGIAAFLSKLKTRSGSERLSRRMADYLNWLRHGSPHGDWAAYPGAARDVLYEATYHHKHHNGDCDECGSSARSVCEDAREARCQSLHCDVNKTISRKRHQAALQNHGALQTVEPVIHFGAYASGNIVMKSGEDRDEIGRREKVIAFEMEGAGIWDNMPTIIVKGVCDYADSHKNKDWQKYAATTAAACVKALLEDWPAQAQLYPTASSGP